MVRSRPIAVLLLASTAFVFVGRVCAGQEGWKGCDNGHRDPTAAEAQAYRDGYALFQRMAPPTPPNWTSEDSHALDHITWVCVTALLDYQRWHFTRTFKLGRAEVEKRSAEMMKKIQALMAKREASPTDSSLDAEQKAIEAEFERDDIATYELIFGATETRISSDFKPMASAVGKGYRQEYEDKSGNPYATLMVVLPPAPGANRRTIVQTSGDPARAQALLNGTKLR